MEVDIPRHLLRLRAHFAVPPSEDDLEDMFCVETDIFSDYVDDTFIETEIEVLAPGAWRGAELPAGWRGLSAERSAGVTTGTQHIPC